MGDREKGREERREEGNNTRDQRFNEEVYKLPSLNHKTKRVDSL